MTGFVRKALTVTAALALVSTAAMAGVPDPTQSDAENVIVGNASGNPLGAGGKFGTAAVGDGYVVNVRDINGAPVAGATVTLNYSTASGNTGVAAAANPHDTQIAPATVDCPSQTISKVTDGAGQAVFTALAGGAENTASVEVRANGVLLVLAQARSTDLDASGETALADLNLFRLNFFGNPAAIETDYDLGGDTGLGDLNIFRVEFFSGAVNGVCP